PGLPAEAAPGAAAGGEPVVVASPFTADTWQRALPPLPAGDLFTRIVHNPGALLVASGALAAPAAVRALIGQDPALLASLVAETPGPFAIVGPALDLAGDRVAVPGGPEAEALWTDLARESPGRPAAFIRALCAADQGRLAWFYQALASLPASRLRALVPDGPDEARVARMRALYAPFRDMDPRQRLDEHPFMRGAADPWTVLTGTALDGGVVAAPAWQWLWTAAFDRQDIDQRQRGSVPRIDTAPVDLAWLAREIARADPAERRDRFEMLRFAQRVFPAATAADGEDILAAVGAFRRYRALLLSLERMGVTAPATYREAVDAARRVDRAGRRERAPALIAFQGALAVVERARATRAIDEAQAAGLVRALAASVADHASPSRAVADWVTASLLPALPSLDRPDQWTGRSAYESVVLQALAGRPLEAPGPAIEWEGLEYHVDVFAAERERIHTIRERLPSPGLDEALESGRPGPLAAAFMAMVYAAALGDPEGPAMLSPDVPTRHDFNFDSPSSERRERVPWLPPRDIAGDGGPWRVQGALVGLDLALARLSLRRVADGEMPAAPTINLNDQLTLARTVVALVPTDLVDDDRDRIVAAIARGSARVEAAAADPARLDALAREAGLSPATRQALPWTAAARPDAAAALFGLRDRFWLGQPDLPAAALARWGVFAAPLDGRLMTAMPEPAPWEHFAGRPEIGQVGTQVPDLTFRLAQATAELGLPARLVPALLAYAVQDFWHDVDARFADDWPAMTRQAARIPLTRIEDYVAALAGSGPLR
ncbi:MAG: hypothetical protein AB7N90_09700, partial [Vicinamibacterales bacterium]